MQIFRGKKSHNEQAIFGVSLLNFLWASSSLMVFSILPAFMVDELKVSHTQLGLIEGIAISCSFLTKFLAGILSDVIRARKPLIILGTTLNILTKLSFYLASSAWHVFFARFVDRLSKGIRSAPTDALIADISEKASYGSYFGLKQAFGSLGQVLGALLATAAMLVFSNDYRTVFALSLVPAILALWVITKKVNPHPHSHPRNRGVYTKHQIKISDLKEFPDKFWWLMSGLFFLMLARFSEAFLVLKAKDVGLSTAYLPMLIVMMDSFQALIAFPVGKWADKFSRHSTLVNSILLFFLADMILFYSQNILGVCLGLLIIGAHVGISQGLMRALIAEYTPAHLRGTAYSMFFVISGIAILIGNGIAGRLSDQLGISYTFLGGAIFSLISSLVIYSQSSQKILATNQ